MRFSVELDDAQIQDIELRLGTMSSKAPTIIARALNRSLTNLQSNAKKKVREEYHIKATDIGATLTPTKATPSKLEIKLRSKGTAIPLDKFKVSPRTINPKRKKAISVAVKKDGTKKLPGAFLANLNGSKVFKRTGKSRLPIERLFGPSVPQMLNREEVREKMQDDAMETFDKRIDHEINRILNRGASS